VVLQPEAVDGHGCRRQHPELNLAPRPLILLQFLDVLLELPVRFLQFLFDAGVLLPEARSLERRVHGMNKHLDVRYRLPDVAGGAETQGLHDVAHAGVGGDDHEGHVGQITGQPFEHGQTIGIIHVQLAQDQVRRHCLGKPERLGTRSGGVHHETLLAQAGGETFAVRQGVVDQQEAAGVHAAGSPVVSPHRTCGRAAANSRSSPAHDPAPAVIDRNTAVPSLTRFLKILKLKKRLKLSRARRHRADAGRPYSHREMDARRRRSRAAGSGRVARTRVHQRSYRR